MDSVERAGFVYDSSLFPTPAYFSARALAISRYRMTGKKSHSLVGGPREFLGPRGPFHPAKGARFRPPRAGEAPRGLIEIPMSVSGWFRWPWLGTTLALFSDRVGRALTSTVLRRKSPAVLELHAMDFLGPEEVDDDALVSAQVDLSVTLADKLRRLTEAIAQLSRSREVVTLKTLAAKAM